MEDYSITDYDIQALIDDELPWERAKKVHAVILSDPSVKKRYEELYQQKILIKKWWDNRQRSMQ